MSTAWFCFMDCSKMINLKRIRRLSSNCFYKCNNIISAFQAKTEFYILPSMIHPVLVQTHKTKGGFIHVFVLHIHTKYKALSSRICNISCSTGIRNLAIFSLPRGVFSINYLFLMNAKTVPPSFWDIKVYFLSISYHFLDKMNAVTHSAACR